jgi:hypothetical protein
VGFQRNVTLLHPDRHARLGVGFFFFVKSVAMDSSGKTMFAVVEENLWRSTDGGQVWDKTNTGLTNDSLHGVAISGDRVYLSTFGYIYEPSLESFANGKASTTAVARSYWWLMRRAVRSAGRRWGAGFPDRRRQVL